MKPLADLAYALSRIRKHQKTRAQIMAFEHAVRDIVYSKEMQELRNIQQHAKHGSRYEHSTYAAFTAFNICNKLGFDAYAAARGGVLHDFEMMDHHLDERPGKLKLFFSHNKIAVDHATKRYHLSKKECNIIVAHMWPVTPLTLPMSPEAIVVCLADKYCATIEFLGGYKYSKATLLPMLEEKHAAI